MADYLVAALEFALRNKLELGITVFHAVACRRSAKYAIPMTLASMRMAPAEYLAHLLAGSALVGFCAHWLLGFFGSAAARPPARKKVVAEATPEAEKAKRDYMEKRSGRDEHRQRLIRFYGKYNPKKLDTVETTLEKYVGNYPAMWARLEKSYELGGHDHAAVRNGPRARSVKLVRTGARARLVRFYEKYAPKMLEKPAFVDSVLDKYEARGDDFAYVFTALVKRYKELIPSPEKEQWLAPVQPLAADSGSESDSDGVLGQPNFDTDDDDDDEDDEDDDCAAPYSAQERRTQQARQESPPQAARPANRSREEKRAQLEAGRRRAAEWKVEL